MANLESEQKGVLQDSPAELLERIQAIRARRRERAPVRKPKKKIDQTKKKLAGLSVDEEIEAPEVVDPVLRQRLESLGYIE